MADFGGGIPGQVASELKSLVKDVAKGMVKTVVSAPPKTQNNPSGEKAAAAKRRLGEVRGELQAYFEEQKRKNEQEEQVAEEQKKMEEIQVKESKKKQAEKQVLGRLSRQYGGTGEVAKSGN